MHDAQEKVYSILVDWFVLETVSFKEACLMHAVHKRCPCDKYQQCFLILLNRLCLGAAASWSVQGTLNLHCSQVFLCSP